VEQRSSGLPSFTTLSYKYILPNANLVSFVANCQNIEALGFHLADTKILLINHSPDHKRHSELHA
jgi:hypothetical protein